MRKFESLFAPAVAYIALSGCQATSPAEKASSITELQAQLQRGDITSVDAVTESLKAIHGDQANNAFITVDNHGALATARKLDEKREAGEALGPLHGIPIAVKDNIHVAELPNTAGTPALRRFVPQQDSGVVERLRKAGAIVIGKTNMHELALGITSNNTAFGAVGNAHNKDYFAGGSSGGTATAIGSGAVLAGLGTDTGGSSRIPAALNGIVGFRPTVGRYPSDGLTLISHTRDTVGPMATTVADAALLDQVLSGDTLQADAVDLQDVRLGVPRSLFYQNLQSDIKVDVDSFLNDLAAAGVTLVDVDITKVGELNAKVGFPVVIYEAKQLLESYLATHLPNVTLRELINAAESPDVRILLDGVVNGAVSEAQYREAIDTFRPQLQQAYDDCFDKHRIDAIIFPTTPLSARPIEGTVESVELNGAEVPTFATYIQNTDPGSNAGIPGLSIPLSTDDNGLPFGIEIDGPSGSDRRLLSIGLAIESFITNHWRSNN